MNPLNELTDYDLNIRIERCRAILRGEEKANTPWFDRNRVILAIKQYRNEQKRRNDINIKKTCTIW